MTPCLLLETPMVNREVTDTRRPGSLGRRLTSEHPSSMRGGDWAPGSGGSEVTDSTRQTPRESPPPLGWASDQGGCGQCCRFQTNPLWRREPLQTDVLPGGSGTPHQTQRGCLERAPLGRGGNRHPYHQKFRLQGLPALSQTKQPGLRGCCTGGALLGDPPASPG